MTWKELPRTRTLTHTHVVKGMKEHALRRLQSVTRQKRKLAKSSRKKDEKMNDHVASISFHPSTARAPSMTMNENLSLCLSTNCFPPSLLSYCCTLRVTRRARPSRLQRSKRAASPLTSNQRASWARTGCPLERCRRVDKPFSLFVFVSYAIEVASFSDGDDVDYP